MGDVEDIENLCERLEAIAGTKARSTEGCYLLTKEELRNVKDGAAVTRRLAEFTKKQSYYPKQRMRLLAQEAFKDAGKLARGAS